MSASTDGSRSRHESATSSPGVAFQAPAYLDSPENNEFCADHQQPSVMNYNPTTSSSSLLAAPSSNDDSRQFMSSASSAFAQQYLVSAADLLQTPPIDASGKTTSSTVRGPSDTPPGTSFSATAEPEAHPHTAIAATRPADDQDHRFSPSPPREDLVALDSLLEREHEAGLFMTSHDLVGNGINNRLDQHEQADDSPVRLRQCDSAEDESSDRTTRATAQHVVMNKNRSQNDYDLFKMETEHPTNTWGQLYYREPNEEGRTDNRRILYDQSQPGPGGNKHADEIHAEKHLLPSDFLSALRPVELGGKEPTQQLTLREKNVVRQDQLDIRTTTQEAELHMDPSPYASCGEDDEETACDHAGGNMLSQATNDREEIFVEPGHGEEDGGERTTPPADDSQSEYQAAADASTSNTSTATPLFPIQQLAAPHQITTPTAGSCSSSTSSLARAAVLATQTMQHHLNMCLKYVALLYHNLEQKQLLAIDLHSGEQEEVQEGQLVVSRTASGGRRAVGGAPSEDSSNNTTSFSSSSTPGHQPLVSNSDHVQQQPDGQKNAEPEASTATPPRAGPSGRDLHQPDLTADSQYLTAVMLNSSLLKAMHVVETFQNHALSLHSSSLEGRTSTRLVDDDYVSFDGTLTTIYEGEDPETARACSKIMSTLLNGATSSPEMENPGTSSSSATNRGCEFHEAAGGKERVGDDVSASAPSSAQVGGSGDTTSSSTSSSSTGAAGAVEQVANIQSAGGPHHLQQRPNQLSTVASMGPQKMSFREKVRATENLHEMIQTLTQQQIRWKQEVKSLEAKKETLEEELKASREDEKTGDEEHMVRVIKVVEDLTEAVEVQKNLTNDAEQRASEAVTHRVQLESMVAKISAALGEGRDLVGELPSVSPEEGIRKLVCALRGERNQASRTTSNTTTPQPPPPAYNLQQAGVSAASTGAPGNMVDRVVDHAGTTSASSSSSSRAPDNIDKIRLQELEQRYDLLSQKYTQLLKKKGMQVHSNYTTGGGSTSSSSGAFMSNAHGHNKQPRGAGGPTSHITATSGSGGTFGTGASKNPSTSVLSEGRSSGAGSSFFGLTATPKGAGAAAGDEMRGEHQVDPKSFNPALRSTPAGNSDAPSQVSTTSTSGAGPAPMDLNRIFANAYAQHNRRPPAQPRSRSRGAVGGGTTERRRAGVPPTAGARGTGTTATRLTSSVSDAGVPATAQEQPRRAVPLVRPAVLEKESAANDSAGGTETAQQQSNCESAPAQATASTSSPSVVPVGQIPSAEKTPNLEAVSLENAPAASSTPSGKGTTKSAAAFIAGEPVVVTTTTNGVGLSSSSSLPASATKLQVQPPGEIKHQPRTPTSATASTSRRDSLPQSHQRVVGGAVAPAAQGAGRQQQQLQPTPELIAEHQDHLVNVSRSSLDNFPHLPTRNVRAINSLPMTTVLHGPTTKMRAATSTSGSAKRTRSPINGGRFSSDLSSEEIAQMARAAAKDPAGFLARLQSTSNRSPDGSRRGSLGGGGGLEQDGQRVVSGGTIGPTAGSIIRNRSPDATHLLRKKAMGGTIPFR
ncbi:unnamed protein product [Amoebophrya sp. A120]|nr:unnamed protein product [Amoebophrya sp. A120]|eukprot:GSA120T00000977001.1